ncbi:SH3 domain-containing protein [Trichocoleus desertorum AS-A10]|uniref:SH3 domain-containing protein n=1 Tax=Trichocoleus desertorum TaxID=1481672 RepID=UPI003296B3D3
MKLRSISSMAGGLVLSLCLALPALAQAEMGTLRGTPGSQINVRSQPSTSAPAPSYGIPGDRVQILRSARGTDGYAWHYVEFSKSKVRGWVRNDLLMLDSGNGNPVQRVSFAPGTSAATVNGSVRGYETRDYLLNARAGQRMTVDLRSNTTFMQVAVLSPQGETLYVGTNWTGNLPSNGDYLVRVGLVRAEARRDGAGGFKLNIGVR